MADAKTNADELKRASAESHGAAQPATRAPPTNRQRPRWITSLRADLREAGDRVLRAQAELDNYRKRARRELDEERRYANTVAAPRFAAGARQYPARDRRGREIARRLDAARRHQDGGPEPGRARWPGTTARGSKPCTSPSTPPCTRPSPQQPSDQFAPHTVIMVVQDGFVLHDRVVRPAQVIVSTAPAHRTDAR